MNNQRLSPSRKKRTPQLTSCPVPNPTQVAANLAQSHLAQAVAACWPAKIIDDRLSGLVPMSYHHPSIKKSPPWPSGFYSKLALLQCTNFTDFVLFLWTFHSSWHDWPNLRWWTAESDTVFKREWRHNDFVDEVGKCLEIYTRPRDGSVHFWARRDRRR